MAPRYENKINPSLNLKDKREREMNKIISSDINKKFWSLRIFLALVFLLGLGAIPANAKIYGSTWKIVRVIDAGTFEVMIPEMAGNPASLIVHLAIEDKLRLPRLLSEDVRDLAYCGRERDWAVKDQQYVQELIAKAKEIGFSNPVGLEDMMNGKTHEITADVIIDGQSLYDLLKKKDMVRTYWCI